MRWFCLNNLHHIPLYVERGLHLTALLFVAYVVISVVGYFKWREHFRNNGQALAA